MTLKQIVEETESGPGRVFNLSIQVLIILSLITFSIETLPDLTDRTKKFLSLFETVSVIIFTVEYFLRIAVADRRRDFIFSFGGFVDLLAILPFYLAYGLDLRGLRALRLFRLFRILKVLRYVRAIDRLRLAFSTIREELILVAVGISCVLFVSAVGIYYFENPVQTDEFKSVFHALWWSVITLSTVGYGDAVPITIGGRIFASLLIFVGIGVVSIPSGLIASVLLKISKEIAEDD